MTQPTFDRDKLIAELEPVIANHPQYEAICGNGWCSGPDILLISSQDAERMQDESPGMRRVKSVLHHPEARVRVLLYMVAAEEPTPLSGAGDMYSFFFHPYRPELLHLDVSTWRS